MIDELLGLFDCERKVFLRTQLLRVPGEVDVQCWHDNMNRLRSNQTHKAPILDDESLHGLPSGRAMKPVDLRHDMLA